MANGEGLFERLIGLVQWRSEGEKEVVDKAKEVEKGIAGVAKTTEKVLSGAQQRLVSYGQALQAGGANLQDLTTEFKSAGASADDMRIILGELGYTTKEINEVLGEDLPKGVRRVDWSFQALAKSIQFAIYRFFTALVVYQLFRKIIRSVSEAIERAIRLYKEWEIEIKRVNAALDLNRQLIEGFVGMPEDWLPFIQELGEGYRYAAVNVAQAVSEILKQNAALRLSEKELRELVDLVINFARQWEVTTEELPKFAKAFTDAIDGSYARLEDLVGIPLSDEIIEEWWRAVSGIKEGSDEAANYVISNLREQEAQQLRYLYIVDWVGKRQREQIDATIDTMAELTDEMKRQRMDLETESGRTLSVLSVFGEGIRRLFTKLTEDVGNNLARLMATLLSIRAGLEGFLAELGNLAWEWRTPSNMARIILNMFMNGSRL